MHTCRTRESGPLLVGRHRSDVWTPIQALDWLRRIDDAKEISVAHIVLLRDLCRSGQVPIMGIGRNANPLWPDAKIGKFEQQVIASAPLGMLITPDEMAQLEFVIDRSLRTGLLYGGYLIWSDTIIVAYDPVEIGRSSFIRAYVAHRGGGKVKRAKSTLQPVGRPATIGKQVLAQMLAELRTGEELPYRHQKIQADKYGVSRDTWKKTRAKAIAIYARATVENVENSISDNGIRFTDKK